MERQKKAFYNIPRRVKVFGFAMIITDTYTVSLGPFSVPKTAIKSIHTRRFVSLSCSEYTFFDKHKPCEITSRAGIAQSLQRLDTGWTVRGSNPGGGEIFRTCPDRPCGPPSLLYNGYRVFPGGGKRPGVALTTHPHLAPRLKKE